MPLTKHHHHHHHHPPHSHCPKQFVSGANTKVIPVLELPQIQSSCKMAKAIPPCDLLEGGAGGEGEEEEGYIEMDISSAAVDKDATSNTSTFLLGAMPSPPQAKEFEFRMGANTPGEEAATCPADELFREGKLLPLHHVLLEKKPNLSSGAFEGKFATAPPTAASTAATTPFESCNISPASSCFASGELNAEEYFFECSSAQHRPGHKKSWSKKLKSIKQSSVTLKLKASRDYLKSLFAKSGRPDEPCTARKKAKECSDGYTKAVNLNPLSQIQMKRYLFDDNSAGATSLMKVIEREKMMEEESVHRKSFSGAINWNFTTKPSSCSSSVSSSSSSTSSSSASSTGFHQPQMLKRSSSSNSEGECSIQGAIAYCKKSQQLNCGRKSVSDVGFYSLSLQQISASCMDKEGQGVAGGDQIQLASSAPVLSG